MLVLVIQLFSMYLVLIIDDFLTNCPVCFLNYHSLFQNINALLIQDDGYSGKESLLSHRFFEFTKKAFLLAITLADLLNKVARS